MVREATINDAPSIRSICENDLVYACSEELVRQRLANLNNERERVFVAILDNEIAGFIHVEKYELLYFQSMANILGIAVKSNCRRKGIGRGLLNAAEDWARSQGITMMRLNSGGSRKEAHTFYRNAGYDDVKEQLRFIKKL